MQSENKRVHFEARMQTQWEVFVNKMLLTQGQAHVQAEPLDEINDFEELDENFPITEGVHVEELEWNLQKDLILKRKLVKR